MMTNIRISAMRVISASWPLLLCLSVNAAYRWMAIPPVGERPNTV